MKARVEGIMQGIDPKPNVPRIDMEENLTKNTRIMSRLHRVFGRVEADPTDGRGYGKFDEGFLELDDDLGLVQLEEEVHELPESLKKELLRSAQCDSTKVALRTPHALITEGFVSVETASITDLTIREAISELGSPDFVFLKEGVYTELLMVTPLLPMAESTASEKSRDWRQVSIEDVPHLYLKF
jgi:DNA-directed RNA polymerase subunit L